MSAALSRPLPGIGDAVTFNQHVRSLDPQDDDESPAVSVDDAYERAQAMAHDPDALDEAQADGPLDYSKVYVKIDSSQCDLFRAADLLRLRIMAGRHCEADCIARDMTDALAEEIATLIISGSL
jgi:hypothetical protein